MSNATITGGQELEVIHDDGRKETVFVRQLKVMHLDPLLKMIGDEAKQADYFCSKPDKWSETLTNESFEKLILKSREINWAFFSSWAVRRVNEMNSLRPDFMEKVLEKAISQTEPVSPLGRMPQPSPSPAK